MSTVHPKTNLRCIIIYHVTISSIRMEKMARTFLTIAKLHGYTQYTNR